MKYGIIFWKSNTEIQRISVTNKLFLRVMKNMIYRESCSGVYRRKGLMTVFGIYIYEPLIFLKIDFCLNSSIPHVQTKYSNKQCKLSNPQVNLNREKSLLYVPEIIQSTTSQPRGNKIFLTK